MLPCPWKVDPGPFSWEPVGRRRPRKVQENDFAIVAQRKVTGNILRKHKQKYLSLGCCIHLTGTTTGDFVQKISRQNTKEKTMRRKGMIKKRCVCRGENFFVDPNEQWRTLCKRCYKKYYVPLKDNFKLKDLENEWEKILELSYGIKKERRFDYRW